MSSTDVRPQDFFKGLVASHGKPVLLPGTRGTFLENLRSVEFMSDGQHIYHLGGALVVDAGMSPKLNDVLVLGLEGFVTTYCQRLPMSWGTNTFDWRGQCREEDIRFAHALAAENGVSARG